tara:strand:+ start:3873 stop:4721 length:849 start_codon:yes stop_codon:yes gene_type:complete
MKKKKFIKLVNRNIGIKLGRFSTKQHHKLQFPKKRWMNEFRLSKLLGIKNIEWVVDYYGFNNNPLMKHNGRMKIKKVKKKYKIAINSVTADFFLHKPPHKLDKKKYLLFKDKFRSFLFACIDMKIKNIVVPLLEKSKINNNKDREKIIIFFKEFENILIKKKLNIIFESDLPSSQFIKFLSNFNKKNYFINFDTGNSAGLKKKFKKEEKIFPMVKNIHLKDKSKYSRSVDLGKGLFNFKLFFEYIKKINYKGQFILEAYRGSNNYNRNKKNLLFINRILSEI